MCFGGQHVTDVVSCPWDHSCVNNITRCYLNVMLQQALYLVLQTPATELLLPGIVYFVCLSNYKKQISYSALTIWIVWIVFGNQKMNEYEYQIPLSGPNYSNSRIVWIIHSNTARDFMDCSCVCLGLLWLHHHHLFYRGFWTRILLINLNS